MTWTPHITVAAIIADQKRFLLVEEITSQGQFVYNQPAGHLEANESLIEAVKRETLEETAWHFTPDAVTGIYHYTSPHNEVTYLRVCFCGTVDNLEAERILDTGILRTKWLSRDEIAHSDKLRSPMVLRCVDDYIAGNRFSLDLLTHL